MTVASVYEWLLLAHLVAAMAWLGGLIALSVVMWLVLRTGDAPATLRLAASLGVVGPVVFLPAVVVVVGAGIAMVLDSTAWSIDQTWVRLALMLFGVALATGAIFQSRAGIGAGRAAAAGDADGAARQLRRWSLGNVAIVALLLAISWDMVFKPGL